MCPVQTNGVTTNYLYDGEGRRVEKTTGAAATVYVYDATGNEVAQYSTQAQVVGGTEYVTADHLGSTRLVTNAGGTPVACHDYLPFGEELLAPESGRTGCYASVDGVTQKFTGKERDTETAGSATPSGLDYFGARYFSGAQGRFTSPDPLTGTPLHIINPQRWNMYTYGVNNPPSYIDPDGRDAIAVNFTKEVPLGGHEGIISVHADGTTEYARFGPVGGSRPFGAGQVDTYPLKAVQFGPDGLPTDAAYKALAEQAAGFEHQDPGTVRMNYFKTSEADTLALDAWIARMKAASDRKQAPTYDVTRQNCATFCIAGLIQSQAIENSGISLIPNTLFELLAQRAADNYPAPRKKPPAEDIQKSHRGCLISRETGECVK